MTLLSICARALDEISSFNVPDFICGNPDDTAKQLLALAKKVGTELVRDYDWQEMIREATVVTSIGDGSYALESDYERIVSDTAWNTTATRRLRGNTGGRIWNRITNFLVTTAGEYYFRIASGEIQVNPTTGAFTFTYEYLSKNYCETSGGTDQAEWTNDTDLPLLPEDLFINGIRYYFLKANNLPYGDAEAEYDAVITSRQGKNVPAGAINMGAGVAIPGRDNYRLNVPDRIDV